jgi:O-antigen/teichoic acid export membrane protein
MTYILQAANFLFPLITYPYVTRVLGSQGLGRIGFANSIANYFSAIAAFGITSYAVRTCARVRNERKQLGQSAGELLLANAFTTVIAIILFALTVLMVPNFRSQWPFMLIFGIGFASDFIGMIWLYTALENFTYITIRTLAIKCLSLCLIFLFVKSKSDLIIYAVITVFSVILANIVNFVYAKRQVPIQMHLSVNFMKHYSYTKWFFVQSVALTLFTNMDVTMMGFVSSEAQIGNYEVAIKIKVLLSTLVSSLGNVFLPRLSKNYKDKDMDAYWHTVNKSLCYNSFFSLPIIGFVLISADEIIMLFCGKDYIYAAMILKIIIICILFIGITTVTGIQVLLSMEKEKYLFASIVIGCVVNFVLNLLIIPKYHGAGAAFTTTCAEVVVFIIQIAVLRRFKVKIHLFDVMKKPLAGSVIALLGAIGFKAVCDIPALVKLGLMGMVFALIYIATMLVFKEEIMRDVISLFKRKKYDARK